MINADSMSAYDSCFDKKRNWAKLPARLPRSVLLVSTLLAAACFAPPVRAASPQLSRGGSSAHVTMIVGGKAGDGSDRPDTENFPATSGAADNDDSSEDAGKSSVVLLPGRPRLEALTLPASVTSRVLALAPMIREAAQAVRIDGALLMAVIDVESGGNPQAVSPKGATGLMQLMPDTGASNGASNLFDPHQNIAAGARYLSRLLQQFGNVQLALAAYNAGEGAVQKYGGRIPPYAETVDYVPRVLQRYWRYRSTAAAADAAPVEESRSDPARGRFLVVREGVRGID